MPNKRKEGFKMKKATKKLISVVLISVMLFSGMLSLTASALSEKLVEDHFNKLSVVSHPYWNVSTPPSENSCAYTAMSMLLSYYDAYWHKDFVPDELEWNTGRYNLFDDTLSETFTAKSEYGQWDTFKYNGGTYYEFVTETSNIFLESYLVSMGIADNLYSAPYNEFSLGSAGMKEILEEYLNIQGFSNDEVKVHVLTVAENGITAVTQTMVQLVTNGTPVIYFGYSSSASKTNGNDDNSVNDNIENGSSGHALIAFQMIDNNTDIKLHTGWAANEFTTLNTTEYSDARAIVWIDVIEENLPHEHSYMHIDTYINLPVCACEIYSTHPEHENHHVYVYHTDDERAYKTCHCGDEIEICVHEWQYNIIRETYHSAICFKCFESKNVAHTHNIPTQLSDTEHGLKCICGHQGTETEAHYAHSYISVNALSHRIFCACGRVIEFEPHNMMGIGFSSAVCLDCGYVGKQPSGNVIMGKEDNKDTLTE